jgi:hypothetical protein
LLKTFFVLLALEAGLGLSSASVPVRFIFSDVFLALAMSDFTYSQLKNDCLYFEEYYQILSIPVPGKA